MSANDYPDPDVGDERTQILGSGVGDTAKTIRAGGGFAYPGRGPEGPRSSPAASTVYLGGGTPSFAWLVMLNGPWAGRLFTLAPEGTSIGRDMCDIIIDEETVSRQHAKVRLEKTDGDSDAYFVYDLASKNGITVNGEKAIRQALSDGDRIQIGQTILVFKRV